MKKILVYLNIPWNFIKQRPQFIVENLSEYFDIYVYYNKAYKNKYITKNNKDKNMKLIEKIKIPRNGNLLRYLDNKLQLFFINKYINKSDYIWIMHPEQYDILKNKLFHKKVIYDCMDDYSKFPNISEGKIERIVNLEKKLVERSDKVFYSSESLRDVHFKRYGYIDNSYVVNNAFNEKKGIDKNKKISKYMDNIEGKKIVYIGAISEWFDLEVIKEIIYSNSEINVILFGPSEIEIPNIDRLYHYGKIEHNDIYMVMECADILIMPFKINDLIIAVDPIKIYEYIYSRKPIIVPNYPEMDKFKDFLNVYNNRNEAVELANHLYKEKNIDDINKFIKANTWEARAKQIVQIIENE